MINKNKALNTLLIGSLSLTMVATPLLLPQKQLNINSYGSQREVIGKDVSSNLKNINLNLAVYPTQNLVNPFKGSTFDLSISFDVTDVKPSDYFKVSVDPKLNFNNLNGRIDYQTLPGIWIKDPTKNYQLIAIPKYNEDDHQITYTFTDAVRAFNNNIHIEATSHPRINRSVVLNSVINAPFTLQLGKKNITKNISVNYKSQEAIKQNKKFAIKDIFRPAMISQKSVIETLDFQARTYKKVSYINPLGNMQYPYILRKNDPHYNDYPQIIKDKIDALKDNETIELPQTFIDKIPNTYGTIYDENTKVTVYKVKDVSKLNGSLYVDPNDPNLENITNSDEITLSKQNNELLIYFARNGQDPSQTGKDTAYVIVSEGKFSKEGINFADNENTKDILLSKEYYISGDGQKFEPKNDMFENNFVVYPGEMGDTSSDDALVIGNYVWNDLNYNGIQDEGEPGIAGATVKLYDAKGTLIGQKETKSNGYYYFNDEAYSGKTYRIEVTTPDGFVPTKTKQGDNTSLDSNGNDFTFTLGNEDDLSLDVGFVKKQGGKVLVKYQIEDSFEELKPPYTLKAENTDIGTSYDATTKVVKPDTIMYKGKKYILIENPVKVDSAPVKGTVAPKEQVITYLYKLDEDKDKPITPDQDKDKGKDTTVTPDQDKDKGKDTTVTPDQDKDKDKDTPIAPVDPDKNKDKDKVVPVIPNKDTEVSKDKSETKNTSSEDYNNKKPDTSDKNNLLNLLTLSTLATLTMLLAFIRKKNN